MKTRLGNVFQTAYAQGADTVLSATLPVDPNLTGPLFDTGPITTGANIKLSLNNSDAISLGEVVDVNIEVNSEEEILEEFQISISYDTDRLQLIDQEYFDSVFLENAGISVNETIGEVFVSGKSIDGEVSINRIVANVRFEALEAGTTNITVSQQLSSLISGGENILGGAGRFEY